MWNPKSELAKKAHEIAQKEYPKGYNKAQLIECGKRVFDGFGRTITNPLACKPIKTMEDAGNMGNAMALIDGHYPTGMSGCDIVGINGGCGLTCPVYREGQCKNTEAMTDGLTGEDLANHISIYGKEGGG